MGSSKDFYILVVDDEESIRTILYETLTPEGYNVVTASSGEEAMAYLKKELPHIVLTDIRMPGISGIELAGNIKSINEDIEVVIMTSHASLDSAKEAIKIGVTDYINKPFTDLLEIKNLVSRLVNNIYLKFRNQQLVSELQIQNRNMLAYNEELNAVYKLSQELSRLLDPDAVINTFLMYLSSVFDGRLCFFLKYNDVKSSLYISDFKTMEIKPVYTEEQLSKLKNVSMSLGAKDNKSVISVLSKISNHPSLATLVLKLFNTNEYQAYPLIAEEIPVGVIVVLGRETNIGDSAMKLIPHYLNHLNISYAKAVLHQQIKDMATKDGLTGLYNHRHFQDKLSEEIKRAKRLRHPLSLVFFDIDHFKKYNDTNGHPMGDMLLKGISELLRRSSRTNDVICRYGGEEFVIILPHTSVDGAITKAEKIRKIVEDTVFPNEEKQPNGNVTISIGVSEMPAHASDQSTLIKVADEALYRVKESGRNKVYVANPAAGYKQEYEAIEVVTGPQDNETVA